MRNSARDHLFVAAFAALVLLPGIGATKLWDYDEALWAGTAAEMGRRDNWCVPFFNGELSTQKPPFMYWMMLAGTSTFGESDFAYRIGSALFGIAACVVTYRIGRILFDREVGLVAGAALASATMFAVVSRGATPDSELAFFCVFALNCFLEGLPGDTQAATPNLVGRISWRYAVPMYAAMGLAVLTKGPIGVLLPTLAIGLFLVLHETPADGGAADGVGAFLKRALRRIPRAFWQLRPALAIVTVAAVVGPWFWVVQQQTDGAFGAGFLGTHNLRRFLQPFEKHRGSLLYYLPALLIGFFPWSMFAIPTVRETLIRIRQGGRPATGALLLATWITTWIGFFTLAQTKLPNYIVPTFPAVAILTAAFLVRWARTDEPASRFWMRAALMLLALFGLLASCICWLLPTTVWDGVSFLQRFELAEPVGGVLRVAAFAGGIMMAGGLFGLLLMLWGRRSQTVIFYCGMSVAFALFIFNVAALEADRHQSTPRLMALMNRDGDPTRPIAQWGYPMPSLVHYSARRIVPCHDAASAADFLRRNPTGVVVMATKNSAENPLPAEAVVVGEYPAFPESGRLLLLAGKPTVGFTAPSAPAGR
jgi:4-amino-4-deoxy-L-arabinose transferase-like glycosyltransferase